MMGRRRESEEAVNERMRNWHRWFAWRPVRTVCSGDNPNCGHYHNEWRWVWLEEVARKGFLGNRTYCTLELASLDILKKAAKGE